MSQLPATERPATFREVLASREFRAVFIASGLSWLGDNAARAAVTGLVYLRTDSAFAAGATFAISYLPWLGIGAVLTALAERHSYRRAMILCDLLRMGFMALVALPGLPVPGMIGLLFLTALLNPPFEAARSAMLPRILDGDRYVVGLTMQKTVGQAATIFGYAMGAGLISYNPQIAVLFNALTFGYSAFTIGLSVHERPPALTVQRRTGILRETGQGFSVVFGTPVLRAIAVLIFLVGFFTIIPEGLAAPWAHHLASDRAEQGWYQGFIMMANPVGYVLGGLIVGRFTAPARRTALIRPFAMLSPLALVPALADPGIGVVAAMSGLCGFLAAGLLPASNALFVQALPNEYRARAFGVMQSGILLIQGASVALGAALSDRFPLAVIAGVWGAVGTVVMLFVASGFPGRERFDAAVAAARRANAESDAALPGATLGPGNGAGPHTDDAGPRTDDAGPSTGGRPWAGNASGGDGPTRGRHRAGRTGLVRRPAPTQATRTGEWPSHRYEAVPGQRGEGGYRPGPEAPSRA